MTIKQKTERLLNDELANLAALVFFSLTNATSTRLHLTRGERLYCRMLLISYILRACDSRHCQGESAASVARVLSLRTSASGRRCPRAISSRERRP